MYQFLPLLLSSTPRKICWRSRSSAWLCLFRVKAVVRNPRTTEKVLGKCKDHVNTSSAFHTNRIPFAVRLFYSRIKFYWHQYKCRNQVIKDLLPWVEFKLFFGRVLVTPKFSWILPRVEKVYNWVSHLKHLQSIEFDADRAPEESKLIRFFRERLKPWLRWNKVRGS